MRLRALLPCLLLLAGCRGTLSPVSNRIQVGQEAYLAFAADGEDGLGDLFAAPLAAGTAYQITFSRVEERLPALSPDGVLLAFARARTPGDTVAQRVTVMNLLSGSEREIDGLPGGQTLALGWSRDGATLYLRTAGGLWQAPAPPRRGAWAAVPDTGLAAADSAFRVPLGDPPLGEAVACDGHGLCIRMQGGNVVPLGARASDPVRWLGDSVVYREAGEWVVRPLAGGKTRTLRLPATIRAPRGLTLFPGRR